VFTATKDGHHQVGWWICELESLGLSIKELKLNEFNDLGELQNLAEDLKQGFISAYKSTH